jgi:hypothetical protein
LSSRRHPCHRRARQPLAIDRLRVALDFLERDVSGDAGDFVHRASSLGEPSRCGLAQTVHDAALRQPGFVGGAPRAILAVEPLAASAAACVRVVAPGRERLAAYHAFDRLMLDAAAQILPLVAGQALALGAAGARQALRERPMPDFALEP